VQQRDGVQAAVRRGRVDAVAVARGHEVRQLCIAIATGGGVVHALLLIGVGVGVGVGGFCC
jgi:hypothetical protein